MSSHHGALLSDQEWVDLNKGATARLPHWEIPLLLLMALGVVGVVVGLFADGRGAQSLWVNFLFWAGLAQAGVTFSAIVHLMRGQWGPGLVRLGMLQVAYTMLTPVLFLIIIVPSAWNLMPWSANAEISDEISRFGFKSFWLNMPFLLIRDFAGLALLAWVNWKFASTVMRAERGALAELRRTTPPPDWRGVEEERARAQYAGTRWSIAVIITFAYVFSMLAFDLVMSLEPMWYSTMFGGYFFVTSFYMGLAAIILWGIALRRRLGIEAQIGARQFHDIGKIMFGFCILSAYTGFSQYLPIWYGDMPEEISYLLVRRDHPVWGTLGYFVFFGGFVAPMIVLLNQRIKTIPLTIGAVALWILIVGFTERHLLVLPPVRGSELTSIVTGVFGPVEILVSLGFGGLYVFTVLQGLRRGVIVPGPWRVPPIAL